MSKSYIPGYGPLGAKIMIIKDCPSIKDEAAQKPFTDTRELDELLRDAGINKRNCWLTTVSKYHVPPSFGKHKIPFAIRAKNAGIDIAQQIDELQREINAVQPNVIIGIGKVPLWALTGKTKIESYRGSILIGGGRKLVCTYNPSGLAWNTTDEVEFTGYWNKVVILFDLKRALNESNTPDIDLPKRILQVCKSSFELSEFRNRYKTHRAAGVDIEAGGHYLPVCIGFAFTPGHGLSIPLWNTNGISNIPDSDLVQLWIQIAELLSQIEVIGQNFNYDRDKILRLGFVVRKLRSDIMMKAQALDPEMPKSLAFSTSVRTREPYYKDEGMYEGSYQDLFIGNARDACVTKEIDEVTEDELTFIKQDKYYYNFLMKLPEFYLGIEQQGFRLDYEQNRNLLRKYVKWSEHIKYQIFKLVGKEVNYNSPKQVSELIYGAFGYKDRGGAGEEELTALLNLQTTTDESHRKVIELILEGRRVERTISNEIMVMPDFDGRVRTTYFPCLETGRSKTGQQEPPIRPTVEIRDLQNKKKNKALGRPFQVMTKHGDIGEDVRSQYIPDESDDPDDPYVFVQADSSQAEARVIFRFANDEQALKDIDTHDYHALTASWFFGGTEDNYSKKLLGYEHPIRFAGKTLRHAGHLGAGKRRAAISVNTDARKFKVNITITESTAEQALLIFHRKQPKIKQVFQADVIKQLEKDRTLYAPIPYGFNAEFGGRRRFYERWGDELFRQAFSYIPQRSISDNTKGAGIKIKERISGIKIICESHDALLFCIRKTKLKEWVPIIKQEMERPIDFRTCNLVRPPLVVPCEIEIGENYQVFHKFKDFTPIIEKQLTLLGERLPSPKDRSMIVLDRPHYPELTPTEQMMAKPELAEDSKLTDIIYHNQMKKAGIDE